MKFPCCTPYYHGDPITTYIYIFTGLGIIAVYIIITRGGVLSMPSLSFLLLLL